MIYAPDVRQPIWSCSRHIIECFEAVLDLFIPLMGADIKHPEEFYCYNFMKCS